MCKFFSHRWLSWPALTLAALIFAAGSSWAAPPGGGHGGHGGASHGGASHGGASHGGASHQGGGYYAPNGGYGRGYYGGYAPGYYGGYGRGYYGGYPGYGSPFFGYGAYPLLGSLGSLLGGYGSGGYGMGGNGYGGSGLGGSGGYGNSPNYGVGDDADSAYSSPPPPLSNQEAMFLVVVPPNAEVWINGAKTSQTGQEREFSSSGLTPGKTYNYEVRARWMQVGQPVERTVHVPLKGGERRLVDFFAPTSSASAPSTP